MWLVRTCEEAASTHSPSTESALRCAGIHASTHSISVLCRCVKGETSAPRVCPCVFSLVCWLQTGFNSHDQASARHRVIATLCAHRRTMRRM